MRLFALIAALACSGCVLQGTPSGGLAVDPALKVVPTNPSYGTTTVIQQPAPTYVPESTYIPPPPQYVPPGSPYPPPNTQELPDWTPNQ